MRTDGSIGSWPVIETDNNNIIVSITEYETGIPEMGHHFFESGLIVCTPYTLPIDSLYTPYTLPIHSSSKEEFIFQVKKSLGIQFSQDSLSLIGQKANIYHIAGFDLNSFIADSVIVRKIA